jgi:hypothetical protein
MFPIVLAIFSVSAASKCLAEAMIYFSQERNGGYYYGTAYNYRTASQAAEVAEARCNQGGSNCLPITSAFNNYCIALAVQVGGNGWATRSDKNLRQAEHAATRDCARIVAGTCRMEVSFCDNVKEIVKTVVCTNPVFAEEHRLRATIDGTQQRTDEVAEAINHLNAKYCREVEDDLVSDQKANIGDNCWQYSGLFRGERVYWGECYE